MGSSILERTHQAAVRVDGRKGSFALDAMAAANAETGQFDKAVDLAKRAEYDIQTAEAILEVYRAHHPYREK